MKSKNKYPCILFIVLVFAEAIYLRNYFLPKESGDYIYFTSSWYDFIKEKGIFHSFKYSFSNYPPLYLHLLSIVVLLPLKKLYAIKLVSIFFDFIAAWAVYKLINTAGENKLYALKSAVLFLLTPTLILNGAAWGQCDVLYTSMILWSLYFLFIQNYFLSFLFLGISFAFKLQSIFLFPLYFFITLQNLRLIKYWLLIPVVYMVTILPSLLAGRTMTDLLTIYFNQTTGFSDAQKDVLSVKCPNVYFLIKDHDAYFNLLKPIGIIVTGIISSCLCLLLYKKTVHEKITMDTMIRAALIFSIMVPYFLPHMHERYFFLADMLCMLYLFYFRKNYFIPIIIIGASTFVSLSYLFSFDLLPLSHLSFLILMCLLFLIFELFYSLKQPQSEVVS